MDDLDAIEHMLEKGIDLPAELFSGDGVLASDLVEGLLEPVIEHSPYSHCGRMHRRMSVRPVKHQKAVPEDEAFPIVFGERVDGWERRHCRC